jgi:hypothetical protein
VFVWIPVGGRIKISVLKAAGQIEEEQLQQLMQHRVIFEDLARE